MRNPNFTNTYWPRELMKIDLNTLIYQLSAIRALHGGDIPVRLNGECGACCGAFVKGSHSGCIEFCDSYVDGGKCKCVELGVYTDFRNTIEYRGHKILIGPFLRF